MKVRLFVNDVGESGAKVDTPTNLRDRDQKVAYPQRKLEMQSDRIEEVLARHKVQSQVQGGTVTPRSVKFSLVTQIGTKVSKIAALAEEIAMELGAREARIYRQGRSISIEVPRNKIEDVHLLPLCKTLGTISRYTAILGLETNGTPLLLRIVAPAVSHVLIAGKTGTGKTALARTILTSLAMHNRQSEIQLILFDPKTRGFGPLASLPHVLGEVATTPAEALTRLGWLAGEMERRSRTNESEPKLIVAIDELAALIQVGGPKAQSLLTRLTQHGREAGIHFVVCTKKQTENLTSSGMAANFPIRLVGSVASKDEARHATGMAESGAEKLGVRGNFLLVSRGGVVRFQAAWMGPKTLRTINERLQQGNRNSRSWVEEKPQQVASADQKQHPIQSWFKQMIF